MRVDRREGQGLDLVQLLIFTFHLHEPLVCPTLDQTPIPETPVQPAAIAITSAQRNATSGAGRRGGTPAKKNLQDQVGVLCQMTKPVRDKDPRPAI